MEKKQIILLVLLGVIVFGLQNTTKKENVAAIEGADCIKDEDCPCWGVYNTSLHGIPPEWDQTNPKTNATAYGIGIAKCDDGACDMTWCYDVQPIGEWLRDTPWQWAKENTMLTIGIIITAIVLIFWPKV